MEGFVFCIAGRFGSTRSQLANTLRQAGASGIKKTVTRTTTHLLVPDLTCVDETNSKVQKARELGTMIVDEKWIQQQPVVIRPVAMPAGVLLAKNYKQQDVNGWWVSEKLDGIRAIFSDGKLWSRSGNEIYAPDEFLAEFPADVVLDGELFGGRGQFNKTSGIVRTKKGTYEQWRALDFCVFDAPMLKEPFEQRMVHLSKLITTNQHLKLCKQSKVDAASLQGLLSEVVSEGGEGLMLRKPGSMYEFKRSSTLLKMKLMHDDECVVIGYEDGLGKYKGLCGALVCEYRGKMFKVGSGLTDSDRKTPPKMGSTITFGYFEMSPKGIPRHPTFKRKFEGRI